MVRDGASRHVIAGLHFGEIDLGDGPIVPDENGDAFIACYDESNQLVFSRSIAGECTIRGLSADSAGGFVAVGTGEGSVDFGGGGISLGTEGGA